MSRKELVKFVGVEDGTGLASHRVVVNEKWKSKGGRRVTGVRKVDEVSSETERLRREDEV